MIATKLNGYQLWLEWTSGLKIYADAQKTALSGGEPSGTSWYYWTRSGGGVALPNENNTDIGVVHAEGVTVGEQEILWQLRKSDGTTVVCEDIIAINVEKIVWPAAEQLNVAEGCQTSTHLLKNQALSWADGRTI